MFMQALGKEEGMAALALSFTILTATRSHEVIGARWSEMDLKNAVWTIPAERTKAEVQHRVPLTKPSLAILRTVASLRTAQNVDGYVFPGGKAGKSLSNMAMLELLRGMNEPTGGEPSGRATALA
jgi:integrase